VGQNREERKLPFPGIDAARRQQAHLIAVHIESKVA